MHWLITDCTQWELLLTFATVEKPDRVVQQNPLTSTLMLARKPTCTGLKHCFCSQLWLLLLPPSQNTCSLLNHFSFSSSVASAITPNSETGRLKSHASTWSANSATVLQRQQPSAEKTAPTVLKCHPQKVIQQNYQDNTKLQYQYCALNRKPFSFLFLKELTQSFDIQTFTQFKLQMFNT